MDDYQAALAEGVRRDLRELLEMLRRADSLEDVQRWIAEREWSADTP